MTPPTLDKTGQQVVVPLSMTLEAARQVIWQGTGPREPIGKLLDEHQITYRDLAWAVGSAYNPKVKEAARTLLAHYIGEPATIEKASRYGPEVIGGSEYLIDQQEEKLAEIGMIAGIVLSTVLYIGLDTIRWILRGDAERFLQSNLLFQIAAVLIIVCLLAGIGLYVIKVSRQRLVEYRNYRAGREAEEATLEKLRGALDNRWTIFRNLQLPGHKEDIDLALVGPGGVWALEVKNYKQQVRLIGPQWEVFLKNWRPMRDNPTKQVAQNAGVLSRYIEQFGIKRWVDKAIVMHGEQLISNFKPSDTPVWLFTMLDDKIEHLETRNPPNEQEIVKIVDALKQAGKKKGA